jgi:YfiH family protein
MSLSWLMPQWSAPARVRAAFSLRSGGASAAPFDTLNLGTHVGDDTAAVLENRRRLRDKLQLPAEPLWLQQVHGTHVHDADGRDIEGRNVDGAGNHAHRPIADGVVARNAGRVLAIQVADCMPVLFASDSGQVVAAAHAGWRGLAAGVLEATVQQMRVPPRELHAWLGPTISQPHFEVGDEVRTAFMNAIASDSARTEVAAAFVANARGRWQCDLPLLARQRLATLGLRSVSDCAICTYADATRCFSYRRDGQTGRMAALVWLQP